MDVLSARDKILVFMVVYTKWIDTLCDWLASDRHGLMSLARHAWRSAGTAANMAQPRRYRRQAHSRGGPACHAALPAMLIGRNHAHGRPDEPGQ